MQPCWRAWPRGRGRYAQVHTATAGAHSPKRSRLQTRVVQEEERSSLGKRLAMLNSVTEHGDPPTNSPQPQPAPRQADTGSKAPVEEPAQATVVATVTSSLPPVTGSSEPSDPQSRPHSLASSEHSGHSPPAAEHNRLKLSSLASLFLTKLWATVASLSTAMSKLGALT